MTIKVVWSSADGNFGGDVSMTLAKARLLYDNAVSQLQKSQTAKEIIKYV